MPHPRLRHRAARATAAILATVILAGCEVITYFFSDLEPPVPVPSATPAAPATPAAMPPARDVDPTTVRTVRQAEGWEWVELPSAGFRLLVPPDWFVATPHDGDRLGDFAALPAFLQESSIVEALEANNGEQIALYARHPEHARGQYPAVALMVTTWESVTDESLEELARILLDTRWADPGGELVSVPTGLGEGWRIQWWATLPTGQPSSTVEVVVRAPSGAPYTVSFLVEESATDEWWPAFNDVLLSLEPLG